MGRAIGVAPRRRWCLGPRQLPVDGARLSTRPASYNGWFMRPISEIAERLVCLTTCSSHMDGTPPSCVSSCSIDSPASRQTRAGHRDHAHDERRRQDGHDHRTHAGAGEAGHHAVAALREPSLGPVFGQKGGATGGGRASLAPLDKINLHHGRLPRHHRRPQSVGGADRHPSALRQRAQARSQGNPVAARAGHERSVVAADRYRARWALQRSCRETGFVITAASEIMAILALSESRADLRRRLGEIVVGFTYAARRSGPPT